MAKYVTKPFEYIDNVIGVEINFNKLFTVKTDLANSVKVLDELKELQLSYNEISSDIIKINFTINNELATCDIERIDTMPKTWFKNRLKDIGFLYSGISGKKGDDFNNDNDINNKGFIPFTNIANNTYIKQFDLGTVIIFPTEKQNKVKQYDLFFLMSSEGYADVGKSSLLIDVLTEDTYLNSFCKGFRITAKKISPKFLNYLLLSNDFREKIILEGKGFTRINLKMEKISDLEFYYPSTVLEQNKIEEFLDNRLGVIDNAIENLTKQIDTYKSLRKSFINDATNGKIIIK